LSNQNDVGFVGLGNMGAAIALRLVNPGIRLHVYDPNPQALEKLVNAGAIAHHSPKAVADVAETVFACLPNHQVCRQVAVGQDGVVLGSRVQTYVEMSTIGPTALTEIAQQLHERGIGVVDAPVSGGPFAASAGTLAIMLAGNDVDIARVMPCLNVIAKTVHQLGAVPGQAQTMKLVNNVLLAANMAAASEALAIGTKAGLSADAMARVIKTSTGQSAAMDVLAKFALPDTFDFGAHMSILVKDVELAIKEARHLGIPAQTLKQAQQIWQDAVQEGRGSDDFTSILKSVEERAGVRVRGAHRT
jgi:3-hydroxyisobutyrate dehydrogenase-like beta-hydroxyacid dehydrogenase